MKIAGLILAGGASRRMGSPKPLLHFNGRTFVDCLVDAMNPVCSSVTVVLGHDAERIRAGVANGSKARFVVNPEYAKGQLTSMQAGLRAVDPDVSAILFTPADIPTVRPETVAAIASAWTSHCDSAAFVVPRFEGRHGHPVLFRSDLAAEFLSLPETGQAREVVHRYVSQTLYLDVPDAGILRDIDDPRAYAELVDARPERS